MPKSTRVFCSDRLSYSMCDQMVAYSALVKHKIRKKYCLIFLGAHLFATSLHYSLSLAPSHLPPLSHLLGQGILNEGKGRLGSVNHIALTCLILLLAFITLFNLLSKTS